jgi:hypothetical protein
MIHYKEKSILQRNIPETIFENNLYVKVYLNDLKKNIDNYNLKLFIINFDNYFERMKEININYIQSYIKNKQSMLLYNKYRVYKILHLIFIFLLMNLIMTFFKKSILDNKEIKYSLRSNNIRNFSEDHDSLMLYLFGLCIIFICIIYEFIQYYDFHKKKLILEKMKFHIQK